MPLLSQAEPHSAPISSMVTVSAILSSDLHVVFRVAQICVLCFSTVLAFYCGFIPLQFLPDLLRAFLCSSLTQFFKSSSVDSFLHIFLRLFKDRYTHTYTHTYLLPFFVTAP